MKRCAFATFGCKVNQYETQAIREAVRSAGFTEVPFKGESDVYIINTCTVTSRADSDSLRAVRKARRRNPRARIMVTGCLTERDAGKVRRLPGVTDVIENRRKHIFPELIGSRKPSCAASAPSLKIVRGTPASDAFTPLTISGFSGRTRAFLKIQDGCDKFCSYCKVPLVRGPSRSRTAGEVMDEARRLIGAGYKEIVLTGICLGAWRAGPAKGAPGLDMLLKELDSLPGNFRVRLSSIEPGDVTDRLLGTIRGSRRICRHLHIPVQSGDDAVLRRMNRPYTSASYRKKIDEIRSALGEVSLTTDALVGFPGETEEAFLKTVSLIRHMRPCRAHIFSYDPRPGTAASGFGGHLPADTVHERMARLREAAEGESTMFRRSFLDRETSLLVEAARDRKTGRLTGYDDKYIRLWLDGPDALQNSLIRVRIAKVVQNGALAHLI